MTPDYPVLECLDELHRSLQSRRTVILQAPPGAGKSTILPLKLLGQQWLGAKKIIMLEPRRLAARSVAMRMADLLGEEVGETVGFRIRFENKVSAATKIEVVTEGILTRMMQSDNALEEVGLIIFDEFHERSLQADLSLALAVQIQQILRDDLRILIMSATLDGERLSALLDQAPIVTSTGRQYPITYHYLAADQNEYLPTRMTRAIRKAWQEQDGDILAFFPGAGEINQTLQLLEEANLDGVLMPLYGELSFQKQKEAILPHPNGRRKIVLSTSIAETSLTIEGIKVVIDSGYARVPKFDLRSGLTRLETIRVTKDSADQRAGRSGRLGPGVCYRLWAENTNHHLIPNKTPEIMDADLAPLVLELSQWGVEPTTLSWLTPPPAGALKQATEILRQLGALEDGKITTRGREMLKLPTHPRLAHMFCEASPAQLTVAADVAALLEERDPLGREAGADLVTRIQVLRRWRSGERVNAERAVLERVEKLARSWRKMFNKNVENENVPDDLVGKLTALAYPERVAKQIDKHGERYKLVNGRVARLPQHDHLVREPWISIAQLDAGSGSEGKIYLAAPLHESDLLPLAQEQVQLTWDNDRGLVVGTEEKRIGSLILSARPLSSITPEQKLPIILQAIRDEGLAILGWDDTHSQWRARVESLRRWRSNESWPDVSDHALLTTLDQWLTPFLGNISKRSELQRLNLMEILSTIIPWELSSRIDTLAPPGLSVPSGSMIKLEYFDDGRPPVMEVRLQEVFGLTETPSVNEGRVKIIMHLLSPGYKPVQVTQDLKSFWHSTYHDVRKELRMRYPKHSWPEDPWTAEAVRGVKKRLSS